MGLAKKSGGGVHPKNSIGLSAICTTDSLRRWPPAYTRRWGRFEATHLYNSRLLQMHAMSASTEYYYSISVTAIPFIFLKGR